MLLSGGGGFGSSGPTSRGSEREDLLSQRGLKRLVFIEHQDCMIWHLHLQVERYPSGMELGIFTFPHDITIYDCMINSDLYCFKAMKEERLLCLNHQPEISGSIEVEFMKSNY